MKKIFRSERTASVDVGLLLGDLRILSDGSTADPAAWKDWVVAIEQTMQENK